MAIEIGNLVVRGSFGQARPVDNGQSEDELRRVTDRLRREFRDLLAREIAATEARIKEGML